MAVPAESYRTLTERVREISLLGSCAGLLGWDRETYMPPGGAEHRSAQLALLAGIRTFLNYFLQKELEAGVHLAAKMPGPAAAVAASESAKP